MGRLPALHTLHTGKGALLHSSLKFWALKDYEGLEIFSMIARLHNECALKRLRNQECSACAGTDIRAALQEPDRALSLFSMVLCCRAQWRASSW